MSRFISILIRKIKYWRLDERSPFQNISGIDWNQISVMLEAGMISEPMARDLLQIIETDIEHLKDFPDFLHRLPTEEQLYRGKRPHIRLGHLSHDRELEFGLRFDKPTFVVCSGLTGFGKTNTVRVLLKGIHQYNLQNPKKKICVIVFNRKGVDYNDLPKLFGWKHYHVFDTLRLSLESPLGMAPGIWINILAGLFCARAKLQFSWTTLVGAKKTLLNLLNPQPRQRLLWPDFQSLLDFLRSFSDTMFSTKAEYSRALKQQLEAVCLSSFNTFRAFQGFQVDRLVRTGQSAVITMPSMEPGWIRQLLTDIIICQVLKGRIERGQRFYSMRVLFVIEEADSDIDARSETFFNDGMSPVSEGFKKGREFGIGFWVNVSSLRPISPLIKENVTTNIAFKPNDASARDEAAKILMLPRGAELSLDHLNEGQCIVRQIGPWPHAMKIDMSHMPPSDVDSDDYDKHPYVASVPISQIPAIRSFIDKYTKPKDSEKKNAKQDTIDNTAREIIKLAIENPYTPVKDLFKRLGNFHRNFQKQVREYIEQQEWAKFDEPRIGRSFLSLIEVTAEGYKMSGKSIPTENKGRGSITHRHFAHWIKQYFENNGKKAFIEWKVPGTNHPVDIAVQSKDKSCVFEICVTSLDNVISHIKACFVDASETIESLTFVTATKTELNEVKKIVESNALMLRHVSRIKYEVIENYIPKEVPK